MRLLISLLPLIILTAFSGCGDTSTTAEFVDIRPAYSTLIRVPSDVPTIQEAIDVADALDTVLVADGVYTGRGNRDIDFGGKSIILLSENGPLSTVINCMGNSREEHSGLIIMDRANDAVVDGFTIKNAYINSGGAVYIRNSSPVIKNCVFAYNHATTSGGAVWCKGSSPVFENCTFVGNSSMSGGAMFVSATSLPTLDKCIVAFSEEGGGIHSNESSSQPVLTCCDVYDNIGGNWSGSIVDQSGMNGNIEADPDFCDLGSGDFRLKASSPCIPVNNKCAMLIGALDAGCE